MIDDPEELRRDSDLFGALARTPETRRRSEAATKRGFQTRGGELLLARMLNDLV